mmetsp:Transcript_17462/g.48204  ORF Transcript_17462/g.48204 Transcript_17462/m.48204 type:complete len:97 (+) Transcript_17462:3067-3357(+)
MIVNITMTIGMKRIFGEDKNEEIRYSNTSGEILVSLTSMISLRVISSAFRSPTLFIVATTLPLLIVAAGRQLQHSYRRYCYRNCRIKTKRSQNACM